MGIEDIRDALVIRERSSFLLTDREGRVPAGNTQGFGLYHADTRHLSALDLTVNGVPPVVLLSTAERGYAMEQVMSNATYDDDERTVGRGTIELRRVRVMADPMEETLSVRNFNAFPVRLSIVYEFGADFADIFDVRGYQRERLGQRLAPAVGEATVSYRYLGVDEAERQTALRFDPTPDQIDEQSAHFTVEVPARGEAQLRVEVALHGDEPRKRSRSAAQAVAADYERWRESCTSITTDNEFFNRVLRRSIDDVRMLWSESIAGAGYPAAGTPWFDALFGRDSCILSMQMLAYRPEIARHTLQLLARWQGKDLVPPRDEEPGKILHELRFDELSRSGELPYSPYYGSVDSTPLFLMLAAEYFGWTNDTRLLKLLLPNIRAAVDWMDIFADLGGDGFISYEKRSLKGLVNQGWKDSWDAISHSDGALVRPPVSLAEVQGYAYAARARLGAALARMGEGDLGGRLLRDARKLQRRFNSEYWLPEERYFALALDADRRPVASETTNPAHCLWAGVIEPSKAGDVVQAMMSPQLFSGWGLRTLSNRHPRYNPLGYHVGTVWPHDNSIAVMGMKMYGYEDEMLRVAGALFDAAVSLEYFRLPELFGGSTRSDHGPPVPYPVACRPQSWAAGTFPFIAQAILGLKPEAPDHRLRIVQPRLPQWLGSVQVRNLRIGRGTVSLSFRRQGESTHVEVQETTGGLDVMISNRWPL